MKKLLAITCFIILITGVESHGQSHLAFLLPKAPVEKTIEVNGKVNLRYVEQGHAGAVPVIFLHGYTDSWHSFESTLEFLPPSVHAMAISQRGHGNSDRPATGYKVSDFARDVAEFIKKKGLGPVIIVGHSMGGGIAQRFALDYPELTKAVVIIASAPTLKENEGVLEFGKEVSKLTDPVDSMFAAEFQKSTITKPIQPEALSLFISESMKVPARVWKEIFQDLVVYDYRPELPKLDKPVLLIWGDQDLFFSRRNQEMMMERIKGAKLLVYEGFGHALQWEDPKRVATDLLSFIEAVKK